MLFTRKITAAFVGIFVVGAAVGALIQWDITDTKLTLFMQKTTDPDSMVTRIDTRLLHDYQLTPDQEAKILPLTKAMAQRAYQVRSQFATDMVSNLDDYHRKVSEQLTPAQRTAYEKDIADRMARINSMLAPNQSSPTNPGK